MCPWAGLVGCPQLRFDPRTIQQLGSSYIDHAVPAYKNNNINNNIITSNKTEKTCKLTDVAIPAHRYKYVTQRESRIEANVQDCMYRDTTSVEHEVYDYTGNNRSDRNSDKRFVGEFGNHIRKTLNIFTTKHSCARNITHNTESTAV